MKSVAYAFRWAAGLVVASLMAQSALAAMVLPLTSTVINVGTPSSENYSVLPTGNAALPPISPAATFNIGNTFNQSGSTSTAGDFGSTATGSGAPWNFQDNYYFSTTGASIHGTAIAFQSDMTDLQARIISQTGVNNSNGAQLIGGSGVVTVINGWVTFTGPPTDYTVLLPNTVNPGSYILQIRGEAATPGSYGGTVTFNPVPLPPALPLLLCGLALMALFARPRMLATPAGI